jgi:hypothetical protein
MNEVIIRYKTLDGSEIQCSFSGFRLSRKRDLKEGKLVTIIAFTTTGQTIPIAQYTKERATKILHQLFGIQASPIAIEQIYYGTDSDYRKKFEMYPRFYEMPDDDVED